ncbi:ATP-binding cassette domain-containing protein [Streptomyces sp. NPDC002668]|uniref:ATP-binding cassette domain-containing protein n=1 Tax=Streptomyces sp. NPDC002668 TaxID=3154422 RepID=UPI00332A4816
MQSATPAIELNALTKRYGKTIGVERLDITVNRGEVFGFLGPNGAGKTTTIRCLVGLLRPTSGRVRVLGLDPIADHLRLTPALGYLPGAPGQVFCSFPASGVNSLTSDDADTVTSCPEYKITAVRVAAS